MAAQARGLTLGEDGENSPHEGRVSGGPLPPLDEATIAAVTGKRYRMERRPRTEILAGT